MRLFRLLLCLFAGCSALLVAGPAAAAPVTEPVAVQPGCGEATPAALAGYFDDAVPDRLREDRVPGAVVSVVSGGQTVFAEGYGLADATRGTGFDEDRSLVRIASVSKLFTWTAVLQQVEEGRLDLDADVNSYLEDFQIPDTYPEPVTVRDLLNHTTGFEERVIGTAARTAEDMPELGAHLADTMPARIRPPGEVSAYSNYGAALAGYLVAEVSGEPYERYVQRHLLDPLRMAHSTATQPVPERLAGDLARGHDSDVSPPRPIPFTFTTMPPDGSVSATATDMARFMTAHLRDGAGILAPETAARMHERSFDADPRLGGYAHGFQDRTINGHRILAHDGSWEGFQSALVLVPDCDLGLFVSTNGTGGIDTLTEVIPSFFDRFVPESGSVDRTASPATSATHGTPRAGFYKPARHNESTIEKLTTLLGPSRLTVAADGTVHFTGKEWIPRGNGLYELADGTDRLVFLDGADGHHYAATNGPAYQLMSGAETLPVNLVVLLVFAVPALSALAVPVVALVRRLRRRPATTTGMWRLARGLAAGSAVAGIVFLVALMLTLLAGSDEFLFGVPVSFGLLLAVPLAVLAATAGALVCTVLGWRRAGAGVVARIHQVTVLAGLSALAWFLWQWNLIGWQY